MKQSDVQKELEKMGSFINENGIKKTGSLISSTQSVQEVDGEQLLEMEFLLPIDKEVDGNNEFLFKPQFHLMNAVYMRYQGPVGRLPDAYKEIEAFINKEKLQQITSVYSTNSNEEEVRKGELPVFDLYVGVNPSIL